MSLSLTDVDTHVTALSDKIDALNASFQTTSATALELANAEAKKQGAANHNILNKISWALVFTVLGIVCHCILLYLSYEKVVEMRKTRAELLDIHNDIVQRNARGLAPLLPTSALSQPQSNVFKPPSSTFSAPPNTSYFAAGSAAPVSVPFHNAPVSAVSLKRLTPTPSQAASMRLAQALQA